MADAVRIQVADAVAAALVAASAASAFSQTISPVRSNASKITKLTDEGTLHVDVVPVVRGKVRLVTSRSTGWEVSVDILVRKRCTTRDAAGTIANTETDPLALLVEELQEWFLRPAGRRFTDSLAAAWNETTIQTDCSPEHLREWGQFTAWFRLTFTVERDQ